MLQSTSQAQQYNPKGKELSISLNDPVQPLDFIQNAEAITKLPQGTTVNWTYSEPKTDTIYQKAPVSITFTYPDGSSDTVSAALTILSSKQTEHTGNSTFIKKKTNNISNKTMNSSKKIIKEEKTKPQALPSTLEKTAQQRDHVDNKKHTAIKYQQLPQTGEKQYSTLPLAGGILLVFLFGLILKKKQGSLSTSVVGN